MEGHEKPQPDELNVSEGLFAYQFAHYVPLAVYFSNLLFLQHNQSGGFPESEKEV